MAGRERGFTLMETLAVLGLLALLVSLGLGRFANQAGSARLEGLAAELRSLDTRARLLARTEGTVRVRQDVGRGRVLVERVVDGELLSALKLPGSVQLSWLPQSGDAREGLEEVRIARSGESIDVLWKLRRDDHELAWTVLGATGGLRIAERAP